MNQPMRMEHCDEIVQSLAYFHEAQNIAALRWEMLEKMGNFQCVKLLTYFQFITTDSKPSPLPC